MTRNVPADFPNRASSTARRNHFLVKQRSNSLKGNASSQFGSVPVKLATTTADLAIRSEHS